MHYQFIQLFTTKYKVYIFVKKNIYFRLSKSTTAAKIVN